MISIVVPAYNEQEVIGKFIEEFLAKARIAEPYELVIVNDGSTDSTRSIVESFIKEHSFIRCVDHEVNKGLGKALNTGFIEACGDIIVTMDADLTHPMELIAPLVACCKEVDVGIASRYVKGGGMEGVPLWRVLVSRVANLIFDGLFFTSIQDLSSGFKAYRRERVNAITVESSGFECQLEIVVKLLNQKCRFKEIPFILKNRKFGSSKFKIVKMGTKYLCGLGRLWGYRWESSE